MNCSILYVTSLCHCVTSSQPSNAPSIEDVGSVEEVDGAFLGSSQKLGFCSVDPVDPVGLESSAGGSEVEVLVPVVGLELVAVVPVVEDIGVLEELAVVALLTEEVELVVGLEVDVVEPLVDEVEVVGELEVS